MENDKLEESDQNYASKILDFVLEINNNNLEEEDKMGIFTELFEAKKQIRLKDEELASTKQELETQKEETANLKKRIEQLEKKLNSVAML